MIVKYCLSSFMIARTVNMNEDLLNGKCGVGGGCLFDSIMGLDKSDHYYANSWAYDRIGLKSIMTRCVMLPIPDIRKYKCKVENLFKR